MKCTTVALTCTIEIEPGDGSLTLPPDVVRSLMPGRWRVTFTAEAVPAGDLGGFAASYGPEDEGLYDDLVVPSVAAG